MKYSKIPSVHFLLERPEFKILIENHGWQLVRNSIRDLLEQKRQSKCSDDNSTLNPEALASEIRNLIKHSTQCSLKRVFNATGTILHTNLGRAPLPQKAVLAAMKAAQGYCNLELSLQTGKRANRHDHISNVLHKLTGCESALAVNNNAGAVLLILSALAKHREVIVSRGELIEIGGGFRIPEVMESSGAIICEVGTTNRTHLYDYQKALNEQTGMILKTSTSNYAIVGFTKDVSIEELVELGKKNNIPVVYDLGSGNFYEEPEFNQTTPSVKAILDTGVDVLCFSGDKLLGGPQAGIIVGKKSCVDMIARHPLARALRMDKMSLAALDATLKLYLEPENILTTIPSLKMLFCTQDDLFQRTKNVFDKFQSKLDDNWKVTMKPDVSSVGGGALPLMQLPTWLIVIQSDSHDIQSVCEKLRNTSTPVITRIHKESIVMDMRTILNDESEEFSDTVLNELSGLIQ